MRFYIFTLPLLDACGCVLSSVCPRFKAVPGYFENTPKHGMQTGDILQMRHSRKFLMAKNTRPLGKNRLFVSELLILLIGMTSALLQFNMSKSKLGREFHSQKEISSNLTKVASSFRTCLHHNGANYGASYRNKPGWSPQLTLFKHGHKV